MSSINFINHADFRGIVLNKRKVSMRRGFTLMELIIVVTMVGIISAFAIPNYQKTMERAQEKTAINNLNILKAALQSYKAANNKYYTTAVGSGNALMLGADLNQALGLLLLSDDFRYACWGSIGAQVCGAVRASASNAYLLQFHLNIPTIPDGVICCNGVGGAPACPTVSVCARQGTIPSF